MDTWGERGMEKKGSRGGRGACLLSDRTGRGVEP